MYTFLLILQYFGICVCMFEIIFVLFQKNSRLQITLLFLCITTLINLAGYLLEMQTRTEETAIMAVKFIYIGKPFILLTFIFFTLECCKIVWDRRLKIAMTIVRSIITMLVLTCEHHKLFYSSIDYTQQGLFPHLVLGHGIVYNLYMILILTDLLFIMFTSLRYRKHVNTKAEKRQMDYIMFGVGSAIIGFILFLSGVTRGYDSTTIAYLAGTVSLCILMFKYRLFDVVSVAKESVLDQFENGIVVVDNYENILYTNASAYEIMDNDISVRRLDDTIGENGRFKRKDRIYDIWKRDIQNKNVLYGSLYTIADITDNYNYADRLRHDVEEKTEHIRILQRDITLGLANIIESRDNNTGGHVKRTSDVIKIFVEKLRESNKCSKYPDSFFENVINAAPMHDLGKIGVPDKILNKPGRFSDEEYNQMKTHAQKGAVLIEQMLSGIEDKEFLEIAINIAHYHHEKLDGTGYPCGLTGDEIPPEARIMALADVFDALVSKRCYKDKMSYDQAFDIIKKSLGTHFDIEFGKYFLECRKELEMYYDECEEDGFLNVGEGL